LHFAQSALGLTRSSPRARAPPQPRARRRRPRPRARLHVRRADQDARAAGVS
jgi:hypothetical protein